jgi:DNA-directed RNA polymerase beta subunit
VVNRIIPDDEMPRDPATNEPYHVLMNPLGMLSRVADGSLLEIGMAKLAKKLGHSVKLPVSAPKEGWDVWLDNQLIHKIT